eukprot:jgi/Mesvir1/10267/Mv07818-RA.1
MARRILRNFSLSSLRPSGPKECVPFSGIAPELLHVSKAATLSHRCGAYASKCHGTVAAPARMAWLQGTLPAFTRGFASSASSESSQAPTVQAPVNDAVLARVLGDAPSWGTFTDRPVAVRSFLTGATRGHVVLPGDVFDVPVRGDIVHRAVLWIRAHRRAGTACTKRIAEVSGSGRKSHPQKGTGRARAGHRRPPHWRKGAVAHGPRPRDWTEKLQRKVRRLAVKVAVSARLKEGRLTIWDSLEPASHKTKAIVTWLKEQGLADSSVLFVDKGADVNDKLGRACANLERVDALPVTHMSVYSILHRNHLVMSLEAVQELVAWLQAPVRRFPKYTDEDRARHAPKFAVVI